MKSELYHSVSWLGSNGRTYLTHSGGRYLLLGIAAIFAAFLSIQALAPAPTFAQDADGSSEDSRLVVTAGGECAANPAENGGIAYYETEVFDSTTPADVIVTIRGCGTTRDNSFNADAPATSAEILDGETDGAGADFALFELKELSTADATALGTQIARTLHLKAGSELEADVEYNVSVKLSQMQETLDQGVSGTKTVMVTVHLKINVEVSLAANPNWRPGFTQVPADGSRSARLRDAFTTGGNIELAYTVESSRTVIARTRIIGTTARVDGISGGQAEITVTATAPNGSTATQTFTVRVREDLQPDPTETPAPPTPTQLPMVVDDTPTPTPTATPVPATATPTPTATAVPPTPTPTATPTQLPIPATAPPAPPTDTPTVGGGGEGPGVAPFIVGLIILALLGGGAFILLRRRGGGGPEGGPDDGMGSDDDMLDDGGMDDDDADMDMDMEEDAADQDEAEEDGDGDDDGDDGDGDGDDDGEEERQ